MLFRSALSWEDATRGSLPPEEGVEFILPRLLGDSMPHGRGAYTGRYGESPTSAPERIVSDYVGAGVLVFVALGLLLPGRRWSVAGWIALAGVGLTLSMGRYLGDGYRLLLGIIPGLAHFRSPSTMMCLLAYGLTMAAVSGMQVFFVSGNPPVEARRRAGLMLAMAGLCAGVAVMLGFLNGGSLSFIGQAAMSATIAGSVILVIAALWSWCHHSRRRAVLAPWLIGTMALVWIADLSWNTHPFWNAEPVEPYHRYLQRHWALPAWDGRAQPIRYLEPGNELKNTALTYTDFEQGRLISTALGYHPVTYGMYEELLEGLGVLHPNFLRIMGIRSLIWPAQYLEQRPQGFRPIAAGPAQKVLLWHEAHRYARPVKQFECFATRAAAITAQKRPEANPLARTPVLDPEAVDDLPLNPAVAVVEPIGPGHMRIQVNAPAGPSTLEIAEHPVPGWRLRINGREAPVRHSAFGLLAAVPQGVSTLDVRYDPAAHRLGLHLTLLSLAALAFRAGRRVSSRTARKPVP